jgi:hypothetical protein
MWQGAAFRPLPHHHQTLASARFCRGFRWLDLIPARHMAFSCPTSNKVSKVMRVSSSPFSKMFLIDKSPQKDILQAE